MLMFPSYLKSCQETNSVKPEKRKLEFLNYKPKNKNLAEPAPSLSNNVKSIEDRYNNNTKNIIEAFFNDNKKELNIIPKKSNIDLKRNLFKKWEKLDKRTEIAIVEILKKKISGEETVNTKKEKEKPVNKSIEFTIDEKKYQPMYNMDLVYDEEMYHKIEEDEKEFEEGTSGSNLINAINLQDNMFQNVDQEFENED